ncbi:hypothetical protein K501DRAFT_266431 [Backusella circina FSU 941]|nr:hypothetical protein K501DRAFT_266431 [Backusella circina FSU 941]
MWIISNSDYYYLTTEPLNTTGYIQCWYHLFFNGCCVSVDKNKALERLVINGNKPEVIKVLSGESVYLRKEDKRKIQKYQRCTLEPISLIDNNNNNNNITTELVNQQAHNDTPSDIVNSI